MIARGRIVGLIVGWAMLLGALAAVASELIRFARDGDYQAAAVGQIWADIHANSLVGFGAFVEKRISPALWIEVLVPLLSQPAWLVLAVPGAALVVVCRRRRAAALIERPAEREPAPAGGETEAAEDTLKSAPEATGESTPDAANPPQDLPR